MMKVNHSRNKTQNGINYKKIAEFINELGNNAIYTTKSPDSKIEYVVFDQK